MNHRLLATLAVACLLAAPMSSAAAEDEVVVSPDGEIWSDVLPAPLFGDAVRWVPGDVRTASFHVRNQADSQAGHAMAVETVGADGQLIARDMSLSGRSGAGGWVDLHQVGQRFAIDDHTVGAGEQTRVQVRAAFDPASTNQSQREQVMLRFRLVLTEASAAAGDSDNQSQSQSPSQGAGLLPETGAPAVGWLLLIAAALVGTGAALVRSRRSEVHG